jgi:hypothetical protein
VIIPLPWKACKMWVFKCDEWNPERMDTSYVLYCKSFRHLGKVHPCLLTSPTQSPLRYVAKNLITLFCCLKFVRRPLARSIGTHGICGAPLDLVQIEISFFGELPCEEKGISAFVKLPHAQHYPAHSAPPLLCTFISCVINLFVPQYSNIALP